MTDTLPVLGAALAVADLPAHESWLREAPREDARTEALLETGVIGRIHSCGANWCRLRVEGHDGWVEKAALWGVDLPTDCRRVVWR